MQTCGHRLSELPEELLQNVIEYLEKRDLCSLNLVSRWAYEVATPQIWSDVELMDCRTEHENEDDFDDHDDTRIISKLLLFVNNPWLASCVQILTHRCHLPTPAIFGELPGNPFSSQTLSTDPRTIRLVQLAAANMTRVHTLRVILGHPTLTDALLRSLFDIRRRQNECFAPVRRLWLENCRVSAGLKSELDHGNPYALPSQLSFHGLESVRLRRLPLRSASSRGSPPGVVYSRGGRLQRMQDGLGGMYETTVQDVNVESQAALDFEEWLSVSHMSSFSSFCGVKLQGVGISHDLMRFTPRLGR